MGVKMKKLFTLFIVVLMLVAPVYAYIIITVSDPEIDLLPGESAELTATIDSNEQYNLRILCDIDKYDSSGNFIETVGNEADGCDYGDYADDAINSGVTVEFTDGTVIHPDQSGDTTHDYVVILDQGVEPGYEYRYIIGAKNSYSGGAVTADINVVPEFGTITAAIALGGAGLTYWRLRRKQH